VAQIGPRVVWLGQNEFFLYDGQGVQPIPCDVWDFLFNNIDRNYPDSVFAAPNSFFNEVAWYFPTIGSQGVVTSYVKVNVVDHKWDYGTLGRTAWMDESTFGPPIGADYNSRLLQHETSPDMDGEAMDSWALSGLVGIADGTFRVSLKRVLPDFIMSGGNVLLTFFFYQYPDEEPTQTRGPYTVSPGLEYLIVRGRGRYVQMKVESTALGVFWRLGKIEGILQRTGRR
jgi:hypothetical protein